MYKYKHKCKNNLLYDMHDSTIPWVTLNGNSNIVKVMIVRLIPCFKIPLWDISEAILPCKMQIRLLIYRQVETLKLKYSQVSGFWKAQMYHQTHQCTSQQYDRPGFATQSLVFYPQSHERSWTHYPSTQILE